jgi:TonB-dependent starch-binding outer membrane protein SusC
MRQLNQNNMEAIRFIVTALLCFLFPSGILLAQNNFPVIGTVKDSKGLVLPGASILLKGTSTGTTTKPDGTFALSISSGKGILVVSFAGYETREIPVNNRSSITVILTEENKNLNEVIVTGYSKQSKRDVTGAASTISADVIDKSPVTDVSAVLQGRVAGVTVDGQGGPGASQVVRLRGVGTFGDNDPLYVIDGVQIRLGSAGSQYGSQDISSMLNPNDIESITVLKDPSLTGLYGAEGSNGVIVITTKTGKLGAPRLEYNAYVGSQSITKYPSFISPQQYADALYNSYTNSSPSQNPVGVYSNFYGSGPTPVLPYYIIESPGTAGFTSNGIGVSATDPRANPSLYNLASYRILQANQQGTNWFREMFKTSYTQNHQVSLSGATDKSNYSIGLNYFDDNGIMIGTYFRRLSLRVNTDFKIKPWLRIGENFQFSYGTGNVGIYGHNLSNSSIPGLYAVSPLMPAYDIAGNLSGTKGGNFLGTTNNPLVGPVVDAPFSKSYTEAIIGSTYIDLEPVRNLIFESKIGAQFIPNQYHDFDESVPQQAFDLGNNIIYEGSSYSTDWRWTNKVSYSATFNGIHRITAFAAYEARQYVERDISGSAQGLLYQVPSYQYLGNGTSAFTVGGSGDQQTNLSEIGNATYSLLDKYLLTGTIRHDGSSKFGTLDQYGTFPSGSVGWRISKENFMDKLSWINELKIRASYGKIGNDAISSGLFANQFSTYAGNAGYDLNGTSTTVVSGLYPSQLGNPYIHWESNITTNLGFDAVLLKNKLNASFNWFNRKTSQLLYPQPPIGTQGGASPPTVNIMSITNKGLELELGYTDQLSKSIRYDMNFNIATYHNNVDYINGIPGAQITGSSYSNNGPAYLSISEVGHPVSSFYGYVYQGIFQDAQSINNHADQSKNGINSTNGLGHFAFKDINHLDTIDARDETFIGNPNPKFTYGYNLNLYYKNFDLGIFLQGVYGNKIFNYWRSYSVFPGKYGAGSTDTWSPSNTNAKLPIFTQDGLNSTNDAQPSSFFVENGSYMRIKNIQLGYTFLKIKGINKLRFYVQGFNLLTLTHYSGLDPEINDGNPRNIGVDFGGAYPPARKLLIGVNLGL